MRVLVVGAGAVGQVYARHLQLGGAEVTFFVRGKYRATVERGFELYALNGVPTEALRFERFSVISELSEIGTFDQVYLTVSSPALAGPWLRELAAATGDATIVALEPGKDDQRVLLAAGIAAERLVSGVITLISYAAPLPGETRFPRPGMAYWFPPLAPCLLSGPRAEAAVKALRAGRLPAKRHRDVPGLVAAPTAVLMAYLAALELAEWSLRGLWRGEAGVLGAAGAREALAVATAGRPPVMARLMARPSVLRFALWAARRLVPLPLETYLREHFLKVRAQTIEFLNGYVAKGKQAGVTVGALEELLAAIEPDHGLASSSVTM